MDKYKILLKWRFRNLYTRMFVLYINNLPIFSTNVCGVHWIFIVCILESHRQANHHLESYDNRIIWKFWKRLCYTNVAWHVRNKTLVMDQEINTVKYNIHRKPHKEMANFISIYSIYKSKMETHEKDINVNKTIKFTNIQVIYSFHIFYDLIKIIIIKSPLPLAREKFF